MLENFQEILKTKSFYFFLILTIIKLLRLFKALPPKLSDVIHTAITEGRYDKGRSLFCRLTKTQEMMTWLQITKLQSSRKNARTQVQSSFLSTMLCHSSHSLLDELAERSFSNPSNYGSIHSLLELRVFIRIMLHYLCSHSWIACFECSQFLTWE